MSKIHNVTKLKWSEYWIPYIGLFIAWLTAHQIIRFFVRMRTIGTNNVRIAEEEARKRKVGLIFAMNHTNRLLDPFFVTAASTPFFPSYPMFYVTGKMDMYKAYSSGFAKIIYNDLLFKILGSQYIHTGKKDYSKSLENHIRLLKAGKSVCIFPEGKLSKTGNMGDVRGGVGYLALETDAIVVPVYTTGAFGMSFRDFITRKTKVVIKYNKPIITHDSFVIDETCRKNKYKQYAELIKNNIISAIHKA